MFLSAYRQGFNSLLFLWFTLLLVACTATSVDQPAIQPVKSANDDYQYRWLQLENDMQVLLISDPDAQKAAAALAVEVGSGDNPEGRAGLAHFLEHMLFLGTDKYPDAAEYERFVTEHGGTRNAYTSFELTNYFFDINADHLPEALDRFAQFFIAPRFDGQYVDREKNAVEAEYQMGLKGDARRELDVLQEVMNPEHPYSQFTVGTLETLSDQPGSPIREELLDFYDQHYSANKMRLVVFGAESLDELQALVVPMFSQVRNNNFANAPIEEPLFSPGSLPMLVEIKPQATLRQLQLAFPIPDYRPDYDANPLAYLSNLIGHEGEGSLLSQLKREGLAESLAAGAGLAWRGGELFSVNIALTEKGAANYYRVLQVVFAYTDMLQRQGPRDWLYQEQSELAELAFRYREQGRPVDYVTAIAPGMFEFQPVDILRGNYLMSRYDADMLTALIAQIRPDNALVMFSDAAADTDIESRYYQVPYSRRPLDLEKVAVAADDPAVAALHLPGHNAFIAEDLSLVELPAKLPETPAVALQEQRQTIWYMPDAQFRVPRGVTYINFRSSEIGQSASQSARAALYAALLMDQFNEATYPARLAGLDFSFYKHAQGVSLRVSGYNDKQAVLLDMLLDSVAAPEFDPRRFANVRDDMVRSLQNAVAKRPSSQAMDDLGEALRYGEWGEQALIDALEETDLDDLNAYITAFWRGASAEALVYGNYSPAAVTSLSQMLDGVLPATAGPLLEPVKVLKIAPGDSLQYPVGIPHDDSVLVWYLQGAGKSWHDQAATALTAQVMTSGFFQQLRTEQQLGYVVGTFNWPQLEVPGLVMLVQSPVADAAAVGAAMETFMQGVLGDLDEEQFLRHRAALVSEILRPDKNLGERAEFYWQSIAYKQYDFDARRQLADAVAAFSLAQWTDYYRSVFLGQQRRSLQVVAPGKWEALPPGATHSYDSAGALRADNDVYVLP